eukprot:SAG31_NODE_2686_length_5253_cov_84.469926_2_plen_161_part_00
MPRYTAVYARVQDTRPGEVADLGVNPQLLPQVRHAWMGPCILNLITMRDIYLIVFRSKFLKYACLDIRLCTREYRIRGPPMPARSGGGRGGTGGGGAPGDPLWHSAAVSWYGVPAGRPPSLRRQRESCILRHRRSQHLDQWCGRKHSRPSQRRCIKNVSS